MLEVITGKVKWFDNQKGYGFISYNENGKEKEVFVHYSVIEADGFKKLEAEQKVEFSITDTPKGKQALYVKVI